MTIRATGIPQQVLNGWRIGLIRVDGTRSTLARTLARAGADVLALPALQVRARTDLAAVRAQLQSSNRAAAWIFVSPAAVRFAWGAWPELRMSRGTRVFAVGPGTASALRRRGVKAIHPAQRHDSEGLLELPQWREVHGMVALVKAPGGRTLVADGLRARGLVVRECAVYERGAARWGPARRARVGTVLAAQPRAMLIATSGEAIDALLGLIDAATAVAVKALPLLVSSARLAEHARASGFRKLHVAENTMPATLCAAAARIAHTRAHAPRDARSEPGQ